MACREVEGEQGRDVVDIDPAMALMRDGTKPNRTEQRHGAADDEPDGEARETNGHDGRVEYELARVVARGAAPQRSDDAGDDRPGAGRRVKHEGYGRSYGAEPMDVLPDEA